MGRRGACWACPASRFLCSRASAQPLRRTPPALAQEFWYSYILGNVAYGGSESWSATIGDAGVLFTDVRVQPFLALCLLCIVAFLAGLRPSKRAMVSRRDWILLGTLAVYAGATLLAICRPATFFLHYVSFLVFPAACLAGASLALTEESERKASFAIATAVAILAVPLNVSLYAVNSMLLVREQSAPSGEFQSSNRRHCPRGTEAQQRR